MTNEIYLFLNMEGRLFYFLFSSLRPILNTVFHVVRHNFVIPCSFLLPLASLCSLSVLDHSFMFSSIFINFFPLNRPKYWCFSFSITPFLTPLIFLTTSSILSCCNLF